MKFHFRFITITKKRLSQQGCLEPLQKIFGHSCVSRATIHNWYAEFNRTRDHFEDESRADGARSAFTPENIQAVRHPINIGPHLAYQQIQDTLQLGSAVTESIPHDYLGLRKMTCRWMSQFLTDAEKQDRLHSCLAILKKFDGGRSKRVDDIITGDKS